MLTFEHLTTDFNGRGANRRYGDLPETCPICHHHVDPRRITAHSTAPDDASVDFTFQCPRAECRRVFVGRYRRGPDGEFDLLPVAPLTPRREQFPEEIEAFAPAFVAVHRQAQEAEARGLDQIAGIGLRRGLEVLVKELAIGEEPEEADEIRGMPLGECVRRWVRDPSVQALAARAAWLDDEDAHTLRAWSDREIEELRLLTRLTVNWLDNVLLARRYVGAEVEV